MLLKVVMVLLKNMNEDQTAALNIVKQACASVVADLENHQKIQSAIVIIEAELSKNKTATDNTSGK